MDIRYESFSFRELGQRSNQEDSIYPDGDTSCGGLFVLCDGMGGHEKGEVASETVCSMLSGTVPRKGVLNEAAFRKALGAACAALDRLDEPGVTKKMGTTLAFLKIHEGGALIAHVGDSRVYQIRPSEGRIVFVTRDHSLVNDLVAIGELTPEEARHSPQKNVITRVLQPGNHGRPDVYNVSDIRPGDWFYLCSDGMLEEMEDEEIARIFSAPTGIEEKAELLRRKTAANRDNHSAHLVHIKAVKGAARTAADKVATADGRGKAAPTAPDKVSASRAGLLIGIAVGVLLVALGLYFFLSRSTDRAGTPAPAKPAPVKIERRIDAPRRSAPRVAAPVVPVVPAKSELNSSQLSDSVKCN